MPQIKKSPNGFRETTKVGDTTFIWLFSGGVLLDLIVQLLEFKTFELFKCHKLENLLMEFGKLQRLATLDLFSCSQLGCLFDSIVHLSQFKTFWFSKCHKLENLLMEFGKRKVWWNWIYLIVANWGVYVIQLWTCHNSRHFDCQIATN
jgi:hypothetical protein